MTPDHDHHDGHAACRGGRPRPGRVRHHPARLAALEAWLRSYRPDELFDADGRPTALVTERAPRGFRRMGTNPHANGGLLRRDLELPGVSARAARVRQLMVDLRAEARAWTRSHGEDHPMVADWTWPT